MVSKKRCALLNQSGLIVESMIKNSLAFAIKIMLKKDGIHSKEDTIFFYIICGYKELVIIDTR